MVKIHFAVLSGVTGGKVDTYVVDKYTGSILGQKWLLDNNYY
jgi:hypothetical protein